MTATDITINETYTTKVCGNCWERTLHSTLTPSDPRIPPMTECLNCYWVTD